MDPNYQRLNNIYHFQPYDDADDLEVGQTYYFVEKAISQYLGRDGRIKFIGTVLRRRDPITLLIRIEEYIPNSSGEIIKLRNWSIRQGRPVYYNEGDEAKVQIYRNEPYRWHDTIAKIPNYVRPARAQAPHPPLAEAPAPEPIKTIEVPQELLFSDMISGENFTQTGCLSEENNGLVFVIEPSPNNYVGECITAQAIKMINERNGSDKGNKYFRLIFSSGASYDVKRPNWINREYLVNNVPEEKTFFLQPSNNNTYELVKLNIRIKNPEAQEEQVQEENTRETSTTKRRRINGGKRNKRKTYKRRKTSKRRYKRN